MPKSKRAVKRDTKKIESCEIPSAVGQSSGRHERTILLALCIIAVVRILVFGAAWPIFNCVDEESHFGYVWKCAHGRLPAGLELFTPEAVRIIILYGSWEYWADKEVARRTTPPPPMWIMPFEAIRPWFEAQAAVWKDRHNIEEAQPPVYYVVAGIWYRLSKEIGLGDGQAVYWIKILNIPLYLLLMWLGYVFASVLYPRRPFLRLGIPLMFAFLPQDLFYSISNGVMSPLIFGAAFYGLMLILLDERKSHTFYVAVGLAVAAAVLCQYTNVPIVIMLMIVIAVRLWRRPNRENVGKLVALASASALPVLAWLIRNYCLIQEFSPLGQYVRQAGWTPKSFLEIWDHPIFTLEGASLFWRELMSSYFSGEFSWYHELLNWEPMSLFYACSSLLFPIAAVVYLVRRWPRMERREQLTDISAHLIFVLSVLLLIAMSVRYDFGKWFSPSREHPYFVSGRLILGTLIPFLAVYLTGLNYLLSAARVGKLQTVVVTVIALAMIVSDSVITVPVFSSKFNWYHMNRSAFGDKDVAAAYNTVGLTLAKQGKAKEAVEQFRKALQYVPTSAEFRVNIADAYADEHKFEEAAREYREALKVQPDSVRAHNGLGAILGMMGDVDGAIEHFERAIEIDPSAPEAHGNLAIAFFVKGNYMKALEEVRRCEEFGGIPDPNMVRQLEDRLRQTPPR